MSAELDYPLGWSLCTDPPSPRRRECDLVTRARRGDPSAFDQIVRRHQRRVYNLALRMLRNPDDAEDVTQDAFLKAFQSISALRDDAAIGPWIARIASNLCLSRLRARRPATESLVGGYDLDSRSLSGGADIETQQQVREAVAQLPAKYRLAVVAYYLEGRSYEEAARAIGIGVRALRSRLYRARQRLRELLCEALEGSEAEP